MTPVEILKAAKAKIADPKNWCQGRSAVDESDEFVPPEDKKACRWCAVGALVAIGGYDSAILLLQSVADVDVVSPVVYVNDTGTHADVMAMFDRAIVLAEASS